jgi:DNA polymerase III delta prime subunit
MSNGAADMRTGIALTGQKQKLVYGDHVFMSERLPPAILFIGPGASGKATLALEFAKRHLCGHSDKGERPCGQCFACREVTYLRHSDCILFSARDIRPACRALQAAAPRARLEPFLLEVDLLARRIIQRIRCGFFKLKDVSAKDADALEGRIMALEKLLSGCHAAIFAGQPVGGLAAPVAAPPPATPEPAEADLFGFPPEPPAGKGPETVQQEAPQSAQFTDADIAEDCRAHLIDALQEIIQLAALVPNTLPLAGIQEIIRTLSRRPVLGQHRVVFIEGLENLRTEGANAFLKTLEEPPPDTLILMTASEPESVLATIRSRSAILTLPRMTDEEIFRIAHEYYGLPETIPGDACGLDIYAYLESLGDEAEAVRKDILRFLELIRNADRDSSFFDFARDIEKRKMAPAFCASLIDIITESVVAQEIPAGSSRLHPPALAHFRCDFLRQVLREARALAAGITTNNFSASQGIVSLVQAFWLEGQGI